MFMRIVTPFLLTRWIIRVICCFCSLVWLACRHKLCVVALSKEKKARLMRCKFASVYFGNFFKDTRAVFNIIGGSINRQFRRDDRGGGLKIAAA